MQNLYCEMFLTSKCITGLCLDPLWEPSALPYAPYLE